jgi:serine/threonine protein kinase
MPFADPLGLVGERLGPYVVREIVTMGGVALIYRGEHEALRSTVAVKVLRPELVEDAVRPTLEQMFLREAQILSQLRSDDILRALDHGRVVCPGDGAERPYIVVDWLEGHPLSEELERRARAPRRPYTLSEALELLEPVARALGVCHENGIVHRDVNPRNVFLETEDASRPPRAKLIDFGFAKEVARTEALRLQRVDATLFARSPDYAAPEHYDREKYGELSENTDIYTFALMLVEMLTLEPPLRGTTDAELCAATTNRADRPTPNNRGARVPAEVEALFAEALAIDQFERPGILSDFWERLKAAASGTAAKPLPPPAPAEDVSSPVLEIERDLAGEQAPASERPHGGARKGKGRAIFVALVLLIVGAGSAGAFFWSRRPLQCPLGFSDCNGKHSDGCEADLRRDPSNCGACQTACSAGDGSLSCVEGQCRIAKCSAPHLGDCNRIATDGCEADLRTDAKNCGKCGQVCGIDGVKQALCVASKCESSCRLGFGDCDGASANGCETALASDPKNCGRCGFACTDTACTEGLCAPAEVASQVTARFLVVHEGVLYFWDDEGRRIERIGADGQRSVVVDDVRDVTGLTVGGGRVAWATGENPGMMTRSLGDGSAKGERISGPLSSDTPVVTSGSGYVSWTNRAARPASNGANKRPPRTDIPPAALRRVFAAPLDSAFDKATIKAFECPDWPRTFVADGRGAFCCDGVKPLAFVECAAGRCTNKPYDALCPDELSMDDNHLYFAQDVRLLALDRNTGNLKALAKRKRRPREVTLGAGFLYWLEGDRQTEVWRIATDSADGRAPEILARRQAFASALVADASAVYWLAKSSAEGKHGGTIHKLRLPER